VCWDTLLPALSPKDRSEHTAAMNVLTAAIGVRKKAALKIAPILGGEVDQRGVGGGQISGNHRVLTIIHPRISADRLAQRRAGYDITEERGIPAHVAWQC